MKKSGFFRGVLFPMVFGNCLGMVLFIAGGIFGGLLLIDHYTLHGDYVEMPDLNGQDVNAALNLLSSLGLQGEVNDTGYVENMGGDVILDQSIHAGTKIKPGRWIYLVINSTEERKVALPADIAGNCSLREAEMKLRARGFVIGEPQFILGDKNWVYEIKANGRVLSPGTMVSVKQPLTLVVGDGQIEEEYSGGDFFYEEAFTDSTIVGDSTVVGNAESEGDALFE